MTDHSYRSRAEAAAIRADGDRAVKDPWEELAKLWTYADRRLAVDEWEYSLPRFDRRLIADAFGGPIKVGVRL